MTTTLTLKQRQDLAAYIRELTVAGQHTEAAALATLLDR